MSKWTKHDELVFRALALYRNVGAEPREVRSRVQWWDKRKSGVKDDRASLKKLSRAGDAVQVGERWFLTVQGAKRAKGDSIAPGWERGDSTILLAVLLGDTGADLSQIIGAVDYINRSIPTLEQLHGSLNRLMSGRLITRRRGLFYGTERGRELGDKAKACCRKSVQSQRSCLTDLLECPCCGVQLKKVSWRILLDQSTVDEAYKQYVERFRSA